VNNIIAGSLTQAMQYDGFGNRWVPTGTDTFTPVNISYSNSHVLQPTTSSWYNLANNQLQASATIAYDSSGNGNQNRVGALTLSYDAENRVTQSVQDVTNATVVFAYDADGQRVQKTVGTTATVYVYDGFGNLAAEYGGTNTLSGTQYLTADHLGSTRLITDA